MIGSHGRAYMIVLHRRACKHLLHLILVSACNDAEFIFIEVDF